MDYKKQILEGAKLATVNARQQAYTNHVYICVNKQTNQFAFVPLEEVVIFPNSEKPMKLKDYLNSLETTINGLSKSLLDVKQDLGRVEKNNQTLLKSVEALSEFIDNQRFL